MSKVSQENRFVLDEWTGLATSSTVSHVCVRVRVSEWEFSRGPRHNLSLRTVEPSRAARHGPSDDDDGYYYISSHSSTRSSIHPSTRNRSPRGARSQSSVFPTPSTCLLALRNTLKIRSRGQVRTRACKACAHWAHGATCAPGPSHVDSKIHQAKRARQPDDSDAGEGDPHPAPLNTHTHTPRMLGQVSREHHST